MTTVRHVAHAVGSTGAAAPRFRAEMLVRSHALVADEPTAAGGGDLGPTPFEYLVSALAACTAITLRMYASRKEWDLATIEVDVRYDVRDDASASIVRTITVSGDLPADQRVRLAEIAERTPVTLALRAGVPINTTFQPEPVD